MASTSDVAATAARSGRRTSFDRRQRSRRPVTLEPYVRRRPDSCSTLDELDDEALWRLSRKAAQLHPGPLAFRPSRPAFDGSPDRDGLAAARLLESIGERSDIQAAQGIRQAATASAWRIAAWAGARRDARRPCITSRIQNRVAIRVGDTSSRRDRRSDARSWRCCASCLLEPDLASTRDQVLEALWPDLDPVDAVNSLNQTVYFLRRVLEEDYVDDLSPGLPAP